MTSERTLGYLTGWLVGAMEAEYGSWRKDGRVLRNYGLTDKRCSSARENVLLRLVRDAVCMGESRYFRVGDDGETLYVYNGRYFERIDGRAELFMKILVQRAMIELNVGMLYQRFTAGVIAKECVDMLMSSDVYIYEADRRYVGFNNGVLDLTSGELLGFDVSYRPYVVLDIDYVRGEELSRAYQARYGMNQERNPGMLWDWKIAEIIPNVEMRRAFQMFCGSLLVDRDEVKVEYVCYLVGPGSNGKSVAAGAVAGVFGERYFSRFTPRQLFKDSDARVNIAALGGKLANLVGDLDAKDISGGDFKRFASGERFQGRRNYRDPVLVQAPPLLCCTNAMPESADDSWGHHRRQLPIHTTTRIWTEADKDPYLTAKLTTREARQWIFNWIYEGYRMIMGNGGNIVLGESVVAAQEALRSESNSARRWVRDRGYVAVEKDEEGEWRSLKDLFGEYGEYSLECGERVPMRREAVSGVLRSLNFRGKRRQDGWYFLIGRSAVGIDE